MNKFLKLIIGLFLIVTLTGCIGETYDFSPPSVKLSSNSDIESEELTEANIDWRGENNKQIEKETNDIFALASTQNPMYFVAGEKVDFLFEHADFKTEDLSVSVWQNDKKIDLEDDDIFFKMPKEKGEYVLEVNLHTDRGKAQYVGNIDVVE